MEFAEGAIGDGRPTPERLEDALGHEGQLLEVRVLQFGIRQRVGVVGLLLFPRPKRVHLFILLVVAVVVFVVGGS